jgi:hypothetical protein
MPAELAHVLAHCAMQCMGNNSQLQNKQQKCILLPAAKPEIHIQILKLWKIGILSVSDHWPSLH